MIGICLDYTVFWFHCWITEQEMMKLQPHPSHRICTYQSLPSLRRGTSCHYLKSIFSTQQWYMQALQGIIHLNSNIYLSYIFRVSGNLKLAGLQVASLSLPSAPGCFRPGLSADPFRFLRPKALQREAGACQSSTARCRSHKHGCPCMMKQLVSQISLLSNVLVRGNSVCLKLALTPQRHSYIFSCEKKYIYS